MKAPRIENPLRVACALALAACHAMVACDPQASESRDAAAAAGAGSAPNVPAHHGDPLLRIPASFALSVERADRAELKAALAFVGDRRFHLVDVEVTGDFPEEFTLDLYEPPPDDLASPIKPGEPRGVFAFMTAVPDDHAAEVFVVGASRITRDVCDEASDRCLTETRAWCAPDEDRCYSETHQCPDFDTTTSECVVTRSGDPAVREPTWRHLAGLSQNYFLLYLYERAEPDTWTAQRFGAGRALEPGYHLLAAQEPPRFDIDESVRRHVPSLTCTAELLNARYGTSYTWRELGWNRCGVVASSITGWVSTIADVCTYEVATAFYVVLYEVREELGCTLGGLRIRPVDGPGAERIDALIGPFLKPLAW